MSKALEEIRKKIDTIDNKVHDLLMDRADLIAGVAAEKKKKSMQIVHPSREARMLRRLLARHKGPLPEAAIVGIWRELVSAVSLLQSGLNVVVARTNEDFVQWDIARDYFGSVLAMKKVSSALGAIAAVREGDAAFAVVPWPDDESEDFWWENLVKQENCEMHIVGGLPYGRYVGQSYSADQKALIVSKIKFEDSGDDHSFIALKLDSSVSRGRIFDAFSELGFEPLGINTKSSSSVGSTWHLVEVKGYIEENDDILQKLQGVFQNLCTRVLMLGGYPTPPQFKAPQRTNDELVAPSVSEKETSKKKK